MTDTDQMVTWLRAAMDTVERDARDSGEEPWRAVDTPTGPEVHVGTSNDVDGKWWRDGLGVGAAYSCDDPNDDCADARHGYRSEARLIATHANPAAVLRRIAADRKQLELHAAVPDHGRFSERGCPALCDGEHSEPPVCRTCRNYAGDPVEAPCATIENLAEGYGWAEEEQR